MERDLSIFFTRAATYVRREKEREPRRERHARRSARFLLGTSRIIREPGEHIVSGGQMPPSRRLRVESKHRRQKGYLARKGRGVSTVVLFHRRRKRRERCNAATLTVLHLRKRSECLF